MSVPRELPILPLRDSVAFPFSVIPLTVGIAAVGEARGGGHAGGQPGGPLRFEGQERR